MAITGDGSATYPFIVTTYEELKEKMEASYAAGSTTYIQLGNDIDGDDYEIGTTFHISTSNSSKQLDIDLHGFAIKNWYIAGDRAPSTNHTLFSLYSGVYIHDGKILNIYGHYTSDYTSYFVFFIYGGYYNNEPLSTVFENVSFSLDVSKCRGIIQDNTPATNTNYKVSKYVNCSFYIRSSNLFSATRYGFNMVGNEFTSCDFYFDDLKIQSNSTPTQTSWSSLFTIAGTNYVYRKFTYCRFQGKVTGVCNAGSGTHYACVLVGNILDNCVINLTGGRSVPESFSGQFYITLNQTHSSNRINLVNIDLLNDAGVQIAGSGFVQAHTNQMDMRENPQADVVLNDELHWDVQKG